MSKRAVCDMQGGGEDEVRGRRSSAERIPEEVLSHVSCRGTTGERGGTVGGGESPGRGWRGAGGAAGVWSEEREEVSWGRERGAEGPPPPREGRALLLQPQTAGQGLCGSHSAQHAT